MIKFIVKRHLTHGHKATKTAHRAARKGCLIKSMVHKEIEIISSDKKLSID
jgi:hypothetical protein